MGAAWVIDRVAAPARVMTKRQHMPGMADAVRSGLWL